MEMERELTEAELAIRQDREARRLAALGVTSLEGAEVVLGMEVLKHVDGEGQEILTVLDDKFGTDQRLISTLPSRHKSEKPKKPEKWVIFNPNKRIVLGPPTYVQRRRYRFRW